MIFCKFDKKVKNMFNNIVTDFVLMGHDPTLSENTEFHVSTSLNKPVLTIIINMINTSIQDTVGSKWV